MLNTQYIRYKENRNSNFPSQITSLRKVVWANEKKKDKYIKVGQWVYTKY